MALQQPETSKLLAREEVGSRFALCSIVSKRARQLNDMAHDTERECKEALMDKKAAPAAIEKPVMVAVQELDEGKLTVTRQKKEN